VATMTVFEFETPDGADKGLALVQDLQKQGLITLQDAAIVAWPEGAKKPKTRQLTPTAGAGALSGAFWGMLFGLIFFIPFLGLAIGAAMGALTGHFADYGIDDNFIKDVQSKVTEGTSALFLLTSNAVVDRVSDAFKTTLPKYDILSTNLSKEQEDQLKAEFGE
jgi:uncharacterized membrane protein